MKIYFDEKGILHISKKLGILIIGIEVFLLIWLFAYIVYDRISFSKYTKTTNAVVVEVQRGLSGFVRHEYCVNGEKYVDSVRKNEMPYEMQVGDTIEIYYDSTRVHRTRPVDW